MSRAFGLRFGKSFGGETMVLEGIVEETVEDGLRVVRSVADKMVERAKQKLSVRGQGPSRPGEPPAMHEGMLVDGIGRTPGFVSRKKGVISVAWGFGIGKEALARVEAWAARRGEDRGTMFAIANMNEYGSVNYDLARSHPPRPFVRNTEAEMQGEAVAEIEDAIKAGGR
jgi:hypothetical protein